jgi:hypothetical protein
MQTVQRTGKALNQRDRHAAMAISSFLQLRPKPACRQLALRISKTHATTLMQVADKR